jgi:hypothetical protein
MTILFSEIERECRLAIVHCEQCGSAVARTCKVCDECGSPMFTGWEDGGDGESRGNFGVSE